MAMTLLEKYKNRLSVSDSFYSKTHNGSRMDKNKKLVTAKCLENISKFMNEAFNSSMGTQRSDMGEFKKFCLNLTTVAVPNLIAFDLVMTYPMSSITGYVAYVQYTAGSTRNDMIAGETVLNDPFHLGDLDGEKSNYTAANVVENFGTASLSASENFTGDNATVAFTLAHTPLTITSVTVSGAATTAYSLAGNVITFNSAPGSSAAIVVNYTYADTTLVLSWYPIPDGGVAHVYKNGVELTSGTDYTVDYANHTVTLTTAPIATDVIKVAYVYDNVVIPQNQMPMFTAKMSSIALTAKARRIAVYYSQIAAFQAKTDYGFDLGDQLAEKAVGELAYEIDTEVVKLLADNAVEDANMVWSKALPVGVSKTEHYQGFTEIIEIGKQVIYDRTKRFAPNYMVIASNILPVLTFINGWTAAPAGNINGPYFAGTLNGIKVFVSPALIPGRFFLGVNNNEAYSSAAVYAPYMAIVPTQLLQYADGGTSQGFSTMYDLKILNANLLVAGRITA